MRELTPENFFIDWKDEAMIKWDRFIYNMKRCKKNLFGNLNSHDDVISFYWNNFNISLSIEDLKERPYIVYFTFILSKEKEKLIPSNEDMRNLIFYDKDFLTRLSNTLGDKIENILANFNRRQMLEKIYINVYPIYQSEFLPFELMKHQYRLFDKSSEVQEGLGELNVSDYDKTIKGVKNLLIYRKISAHLNEEPIYLYMRIHDEKSLRKMVIPDSVRSLALEYFDNNLNEGLIDFEVGYSLRHKVYQLPSSVKSLEVGEVNKFYSESLECLKTRDFATLKEGMTRNVKVFVTESHHDNYAIFHNLEILACRILFAEEKLPPKLIAIFTNHNQKTKFPNGLKYLHIDRDSKVKNIIVPEGLQYLHITEFSSNLPKSLIYLYTSNHELKIDLKELPNLVYLTVDQNVEIKNLRDNIMIKYI